MSEILTDGISAREKLIREGFCFDSDRDCEAAKYLIGVIDTIRWDRKLLRDDKTRLTEELDRAETALKTVYLELNRLSAVAQTPLSTVGRMMRLMKRPPEPTNKATGSQEGE
jgi:hypothetical protein